MVTHTLIHPVNHRYFAFKENNCEPPENPRHSIEQYCQIDHSNVELIKTALDKYKSAVAVIINIHNINAFRHYEYVQFSLTNHVSFIHSSSPLLVEVM